MIHYTVIPNNPELKEMVTMQSGIVYACPDGEELALQLLKPQWSSGGSGFPLVVFIQGSGWTKPDQFLQLPQLTLLARRGYVVASVTHRSLYTAAAPAFLQDVKTAIRFLRAHAEEYDLDPTRVCAWGTSSGGNTALLLGVTGDDPAFETEDWKGHSSAVQAVIDCFGPSDVRKRLDVRYAGMEDDYRVKMLKKLGGSEDRATAAAGLDVIGPMRYLRPGMKLPPFLLLHGDADAVVDYRDSEEFAEKLDECGYDTELVRITNAGHESSFWSMRLFEIAFDFIARSLA